MLQYIAISNISIFLSGILYCIAVVNIAIYQYIVILLHPLIACIKFQAKFYWYIHGMNNR